jgi:hypothetical protein
MLYRMDRKPDWNVFLNMATNTTTPHHQRTCNKRIKSSSNELYGRIRCLEVVKSHQASALTGQTLLEATESSITGRKAHPGAN